jgi:hypothetical protein
VKAVTNLALNPDALNATTNGLRDIKPPLGIPSGWSWVLLLSAILLLTAMLFLVWQRWHKHRMMVPPIPVIPPHVRARKKLDEALALIGQAREFCILVSDTIRWYLEERFQFHAPERTTEEFLYELQVTDLLTEAQKQSLVDFLARCDLVKFARYEPGQPELRDLHASAVRLVDETEPKPPPPPEQEDRSTTPSPPSAVVAPSTSLVPK